ncbi:MAG: hypothetical protein Unbinned1819contig1001_50 [Prokaryotic dsDNA virus sp.]|nr:MAG: hypothetical protein Unbinned1819contig1001_50 [Prokaryotic dsDNA virus sp.]|tara:strand:- start:10447 stop:10641 length:195 start_codon:yes stop_codon:yes gene_type:complete
MKPTKFAGSDQQRLEKALQIRKALYDLMTNDEHKYHEDLIESFNDYVHRLTVNFSNSLHPLELS